jgi:hypothetical protein
MSELQREEQGEDEHPSRKKRISSSSRPTAIHVSGRESGIFHCCASSNARNRLGAVFGAFEGGTVLGRVRDDGFALGSDARPPSFTKKTNKSDLASSGGHTSTVMMRGFEWVGNGGWVCCPADRVRDGYMAI